MLLSNPNVQFIPVSEEEEGGLPLPATHGVWARGFPELGSQLAHICLSTAPLLPSTSREMSLLQTSSLSRVVSWKSDRTFLIGGAERCNLCPWPALRSSLSADHIGGGRGENNYKQTKMEWGGWDQIRLISPRLFCMFIFNLGLATSKFT